MSTLSAPTPRIAHPQRVRILALIGAILLLLATAAEAIAGNGCAHHGAGVMAEMQSPLHADAGSGPDHERFPGEHRACTCIGDCLAPTAILPPDAAVQPAPREAETRTVPFPARALDPHGCAPYTLPYAQAPPLAG